MRTSRFVALLLAVATVVAVATPVSHAANVSLKGFSWHDFDAEIIKLLSFDAATMLYYTEMASINQEQLAERRDYERIGCMPFSIIRNGTIVEKGYNCKSFMCVGYLRGPKQCIDTAGKPNGGVVEIARRMGLITIEDVRKNFSAFASAEQTPYMRQRILELGEVRCTPYYLMMFDILVAEAYECEEVGRFPFFSAANTCVDSWRDSNNEFVCKTPPRSDEFDRRREAIALRPGGVHSSSSVGSSGSSVSSGSGSMTGSGSSASSVSSDSSSSSSISKTFPDVIQGQYGYTAIMDLTHRGVVQGYPDGTFKPTNTVNRAEFVRLLIGGLHPDEAANGEMYCFPDVTNQWFAPYVCAAKRLGWVQGYKDGKFRPSQTIRRDEGLKIVVASLSLPMDSASPLPPDVADGTWFTPYARKAMELRMILEPLFRPMQLSTRADAAVWMYRALRAREQMEAGVSME